MTKIEFFIVRYGAGYRLLDGAGEPHVLQVFETRAVAADIAIRFAQDLGALYAVHG